MRLPVTVTTPIRAAGCVVWLVWALGTAEALEPPRDDTSIGYNLYSGGGLTVQGPAIIVKKALLKRMSVEVGTRVDLISSASVDVVTQASAYRERRTEYTLGTQVLHDDILTGINYTQSRESDYTSNTLSIGMAHDLFDKNTTMSLRVSHSWDKVGKNGDPSFGWKDFDRTIYAAGVTQSVTPRWLLQVNYEGTADSGFINNPYRSALTQQTGGLTSLVPENYPEARTGHAWVLRTGYGFVPDSVDEVSAGKRSSLQLDYRYYQDTFDIHAQTSRVTFQRYVASDWLLGSFYQYHRQSDASFYGDHLPSTQLFKARDKELSQFSDHWIGGSLKYKPQGFNWHGLENLYVQFGYSFAMYDYDNFTDPRTGELYSLRAHVLHTSLGFTY
ncbi:MAG: DUF3570 domain-containing protein [Nitrospirae bacterium]|nr:DUF3570 domain-containing protein [Nitrospirota bacterium]